MTISLSGVFLGGQNALLLLTNEFIN